MSLSDEIEHVIQHHERVQTLLSNAAANADQIASAILITTDADGIFHIATTDILQSECVGLLSMAKHWVLAEWWEQFASNDDTGDKP